MNGRRAIALYFKHRFLQFVRAWLGGQSMRQNQSSLYPVVENISGIFERWVRPACRRQAFRNGLHLHYPECNTRTSETKLPLERGWDKFVYRVGLIHLYALLNRGGRLADPHPLGTARGFRSCPTEIWFCGPGKSGKRDAKRRTGTCVNFSKILFFSQKNSRTDF